MRNLLPERGLPAQLVPWVGPAAILLTFLYMLQLTWGTWPDVLIDSGRELYVAWQLAEGRRLYTDVAYFNGPLSPYWNSLLFRIFGSSIRTLVLGNLALLAVLMCLLYRILIRISDVIAATVACLVFTLVFVFSQIILLGSFSYIFPYSHEMTHGILLSLASLFLLHLHDRSRKEAHLIAAGLALGCAFLTKAEVFVAAAAGSGVHLGLSLWMGTENRGCRLRALFLFAGAATMPAILSFFLLWLAMPADRALWGTLGSWPHVWSGEVASNQFYRSNMGINRPAETSWKMLVWTGYYLGFLAAASGVGLALRRWAWCRVVLEPAVFFLTAWALISMNPNYFYLLRPAPLVLTGIGLAFSYLIYRERKEGTPDNRRILQISFTVFAFILLAKIILNARVLGYGFALAMPATLVMVIAALSWAPAALAHLGGWGGAIRAAGLAVIVVYAITHVGLHRRFFLSQNTVPVSQGWNRFYADLQRGGYVNRTLSEIERLIRPDQTLAVFPEGVMLNYLTRRVNPTPYVNFMPPELIMFGEDRILAAFQKHPPDYIALAHKDTSNYGFRFFGHDYGRKILSWIYRHYRPIRLIGSPPLRTERFGILLMALPKGPPARPMPAPSGRRPLPGATSPPVIGP